MYIAVEKQLYVNEFQKKYIAAAGDDDRLKALDTEFAEHIVLNNPE